MLYLLQLNMSVNLLLTLSLRVYLLCGTSAVYPFIHPGKFSNSVYCHGCHGYHMVKRVCSETFSHPFSLAVRLEQRFRELQLPIL